MPDWRDVRAMLEYQDLSTLLKRANAEPDAAECHGFLCGQLCGSPLQTEETWREFLDLQTGDALLAEQCYEEVRRMLADVGEQLQSLELEFRLFLPEDEVALRQRIMALSEWCHGFLSGLAPGAGRHVLSEDAREWLTDMEMIARVEPAPGNGDEDDDEASLYEVAEYVRTGVMILADELRPQWILDKPEALH